MRSNLRRLLSILLAIVISLIIIPSFALAFSTSNTITTNNIIEYGSYPQTRITNTSLIASLNSQALSSEKTVTFNGAKYKKVCFTQYTPWCIGYTQNSDNSFQDDNGYYTDTVYWFKFEPVQWRVLSNTNGELFVISGKILDSGVYNQVDTNITWETCSVRAWLNDEFYYAAFNSTEQSKIKISTIVNSNNPLYGTYGGNNTSDKLFMASYSEIANSAYGFNSSYDSVDTARITQGTDFAKSKGLRFLDSSYLGNSFWWLRSPGYGQNCAGVVTYDGLVRSNFDVYNTYIGIRPAFKINCSSQTLKANDDNNCTVDYLSGFLYGLDPGFASLSDYIEVVAGYELHYTQTNGVFGTGTIVDVTFDGVILDTYKIIIFGDVNGDSTIDSIDAGVMVDYENYLLNWDTVDKAVYLIAGDLNGDGTVDSLDAGIAIDVENYEMNIDQSTGLASPT